MEELPRRRIWLPSPGFLVMIGVAVVATAMAIPGLRSSRRASNERHASTMLKTLTSAEADFRANDRDGNKIADFWTGDVSGLYYVKTVGGGPEIRLIEADVANADAHPLFPLLSGGTAFEGYRYQALEWDDSQEGDKGNYRIDTDKSGRKVHHPAMFGFRAFPADSASGKYLFAVNENNTIFRWPGSSRTTWPTDQELKQLSCPD